MNTLVEVQYTSVLIYQFFKNILNSKLKKNILFILCSYFYLYLLNFSFENLKYFSHSIYTFPFFILYSSTIWDIYIQSKLSYTYNVNKLHWKKKHLPSMGYCIKGVKITVSISEYSKKVMKYKYIFVRLLKYLKS